MATGGTYDPATYEAQIHDDQQKIADADRARAEFLARHRHRTGQQNTTHTDQTGTSR